MFFFVFFFKKSLSFVRVHEDYRFLLRNVLTVYIKFILCQMFFF